MEGGVSSRSSIEALDEFKSNASGLRSCLKGLAIDTFAFETLEETFPHPILVTISSTAQAYSHVFLLQEHLIALARLGTPAIRMLE